MVTSLVQLLCRMTKLCWFDDDAFRNIVDDAKQFLEKVRLCILFAAFLCSDRQRRTARRLACPYLIRMWS